MLKQKPDLTPVCLLCPVISKQKTANKLLILVSRFFCSAVPDLCYHVRGFPESLPVFADIGNKTGKNALFFLIAFLLSRNQETNQENHTSETMNHNKKEIASYETTS